MFRTTHKIKRATTTVVLAAAIGALSPPAALAGGSSRQYQDGWYGYTVAQTNQHHVTTLLDGRSPDTRDAAAAAAHLESPYGPPDGWYGYAVTLTKQGQTPILLDGRSPDTRDAAIQAHSPIVTIVRSPGFQWSDFGVGIGAALGVMLIVALSVRLLAARHARKQPGPVATA